MDQKYIQQIGGLEFILESFYQSYFKNREDQTLLEIISIVELFKVYYKLKFWFKSVPKSQSIISPNQLFLSFLINNQNYIYSDYHPQQHQQQQQQKSVKMQIKETLLEIQNKKRTEQQGQKEYLVSQNKQIQINNQVNIPDQILKKQLDKEGELRVKIGELIFVARPVIYSFMLVKYGVHSFKPYLWSLGLDLLRVWLERKIEYYHEWEKQEMMARNREMLICYLLRNPFYSKVLKKLVEQLLNKLVPNKLRFIKSIIFALIELRCSLSLLM